MFTISVETCFTASHQLILPDGSKETAHEHDWLVTAEITAEMLNNDGMVMDFCRLKDVLDSIVAELDNGPLSRIDYFQKNNPSAENVAKYVYEKLLTELDAGIKLRCVRVMEHPGCWAEFAE